MGLIKLYNVDVINFFKVEFCMSDSREPCPRCGEPKSLLMACQNCGYSKRSAQMKKHNSQVCPRCGAFATKGHIERKDCKVITLPDYDKMRSENDVFSRGLVRSGGGFGVGKKKKK